MCALAITVSSAIWTKERGSLPALAQIGHPVDRSVDLETETATITPQLIEASYTTAPATETIVDEESIARAIEADANGSATQLAPAEEAVLTDTSVRWFDGKMVRPTRVIYMTVTGYSPDARSCGIYADNKTATMYSVWTNGMNLVAADPKVLPYWSMISIPGYASDDIVPVLDCGGAIKGNRLDLLYPTHELARVWGVRQLPVTVWEYVEEEQD